MKGNCSPWTAGSGMVGVDGCWSAKLDGEFKFGRGNSSDGGGGGCGRRLFSGDWWSLASAYRETVRALEWEKG
jgi:hypothetical protein